MRTVIPKRLRSGDTVAVVALSAPRVAGDTPKIKAAQKYIESLGMTVRYGENLKSSHIPLGVASVKERLSDLHGLLHENAQAVFIYAGGDNANQIISEIDYGLVRSTAPVFCGYSDSTVVLNAITNTTGLTTYYGPNFGSFGSEKEQQFLRSSFEQATMSAEPYTLKDTTRLWYDRVYTKQRTLYPQHTNSGWWTLNKNPLIGQGRLIGGEISTMLLLHGTPHAPSYKKKILFLEMYQGNLATFDRMLEAILQQKHGDRLEGLLIGRFQHSAKVTKQELAKLISQKPQLEGVPVVANLDFGHTLPMMTLPIGGEATVRVGSKQTEIIINEH